MPTAVDQGFRVFTNHDPQPLTPADKAALYATALLTLFACCLTVVPLYLLARAALPAPAAWAAAALWPLAPAANLFQPVADTAYPLLSTSALAMAAWSAQRTPATRLARIRRHLLRSRFRNGDGVWNVLHARISPRRTHGRAGRGLHHLASLAVTSAT